MSQEKSEALVLRGVDFGESSRILTLLTPKRGRLACIAKGVRRRNSPLAAAVDTMNHVEALYLYKEGREVQTLTEASLIDGFRGVKSDLERNAYAAFPLEMAGRIVHENEPSEALFATLLEGLQRLAVWQGDVRMHVSWQVLHLLAAAGFAPELWACSVCGAAAPANPGFRFDGGISCRACRSDCGLSAAAYEALLAMAADAHHCQAQRGGGELFKVLRRYAVQQTESEYRSLRVIDQIFAL